MQIDYRLPTSLLPKHYEILLHPELDTGNFTGQEVITIEVIEATKQIILHSHKLSLTSVFISNRNVDSFELDTVREFLIVNVSEELTVGEEIKLNIVFEGEMQNKLVGLYSSSYQTPAGNKR